MECEDGGKEEKLVRQLVRRIRLWKGSWNVRQAVCQREERESVRRVDGEEVMKGTSRRPGSKQEKQTRKTKLG